MRYANWMEKERSPDSSLCFIIHSEPYYSWGPLLRSLYAPSSFSSLHPPQQLPTFRSLLLSSQPYTWRLPTTRFWRLYTQPHSSYSNITASYKPLLPSQVLSKISSSLQAKYMVDIEQQIPPPFDPFADAKELGGAGTKEYVHIRIQQRNGKKCLTTVQGLPKDFSYDKILKALKKDFCCNGNVVKDKELGKVIQLQGDQRKNVQSFLVNGNLVSKDQIKIHGF